MIFYFYFFVSFVPWCVKKWMKRWNAPRLYLNWGMMMMLFWQRENETIANNFIKKQKHMSPILPSHVNILIFLYLDQWDSSRWVKAWNSNLVHDKKKKNFLLSFYKMGIFEKKNQFGRIRTSVIWHCLFLIKLFYKNRIVGNNKNIS